MLKNTALVLGLLSVANVHVANGRDWSGVEAVLNHAISKRVMPGCVAAVTLEGEVIYSKAFGNFTYGKAAPQSGYNPPTELRTKYDLAR